MRAANWRTVAPAVVVFAVVLVGWEVGVRVAQVQSFILPAPTAIAAAVVEQWPTLSAAARGTFGGALAGLTVGAALAAAAAGAAARWSGFRAGAMPLAVAANSMPIIVLAPVANAWFGLVSPVGTVVVVAVLVFFPFMINMVKGLLSASAAHHELMATYAATRRNVLWRVQVPAALPFVFSALKIATPLAVIGAIVKEYFGGPQDRLGQYITSRAGLFQFDEAWAAIVVASTFGIFLYLLILLAERRVIGWHASLRTTN